MSLLVGFILSIFFSVDMEKCIGIIAKTCVKSFKYHLSGYRPEHMAYGTVLVIAVCTAVFVVTELLWWGLGSVSPVLRFIFEAAVYCSVFESGKIFKKAYKAYKDGNLSDKDIKEVCMDIAQSISFGITAPMLYGGIGGVGAAVVYKTALGIGRAIEETEFDGYNRFAVRVCDIFDFIPKHVTAAAVLAGCRLLGGSYGDAIEVFWEDKNKNGYRDSLTLSAFAGALGLKFGESSTAFKDCITSQPIGRDIKTADIGDIKKSIHLAIFAAAVMLVTGVALRYIFA